MEENRAPVLQAAQYGSIFYRSWSSRERVFLDATSHTTIQTAGYDVKFYIQGLKVNKAEIAYNAALTLDQEEHQ